MLSEVQSEQPPLTGWTIVPAENVCTKITKGTTPHNSDIEAHGTIPFVRVNNLSAGGAIGLRGDMIYVSKSCHAGLLARSIAMPNDILMNIVGPPLGKLAKLTDHFAEYNLNQAILIFRPDNQYVDADFFYYFACSYTAQEWLRARSKKTSGQQNLTIELCRELPVPIPPLPEQRKIAEILRSWDEAIDACERRGASLRKQVEGLRLRLFEAAYASANRVRQAKELFEPVSEKNQSDLPLLAVMQDIGIIRRDELDRRVVMPDGSIDGYKVVREGDFVISLRSFEGGLEFSRVTGLVSPAYTVLRPNGGDYVGDYYRHFFKSRSFIGRLDRLIFGIRDGKQISFRDFGDMKIPNPTEDEQTTAATVLGLAEQQIALADHEAAKLQEQKRGLMQKLLTGEWRVNV